MTSEQVAWMEQLHRIPRWGRIALLVVMHSLLFTAAYFGAFLIRFDFQIPEGFQGPMFQAFGPLLAVKVVIFGFFRMYQGWWKYVSLYDMVALLRALVAATGVFLALNVLVITPTAFPRSIYLLDFVLSFLLIGGTRGSLRMFREAIVNRTGDTVPVLIAGAGDTGEALIREILRNRNICYRPVGFLDDDPYKVSLRLNGVPVLGPMEALPAMVEKHGIKEVIIAMPSASRKDIRRVVELAQRSKIRARIVPAFEAVVEGKVSVNQLREVAITDLLGRAPVELNTQAIGRFLEGRRVLVTGAGGSIGSEICRQVMRFNPAELIMVDSAETPLFFIHRELSKKYKEKLKPTIADVSKRERMEAVFKEHAPQVVLHAAAYKHVPLMEAHPCEAVRNNLGGTRVVADLSAANQVEAFVLISTDKAVNPTSIMGATKRASELYVRHVASKQSDTRFCAVRFGNVLGSNGSVIPIFRRQLEGGGPLTVTHPEMTRYFMTIPEATQLVLQAASFSKGDLFILDMGEPVKIIELARDMIRLSGFTEEEVPIEISGIRPGEKLFEELTLDKEEVSTTEHEKIFIGKEDEPLTDRELEILEGLLLVADQGKDVLVRTRLRELIPTYQKDHRHHDEKVIPLKRQAS